MSILLPATHRSLLQIANHGSLIFVILIFLGLWGCASPKVPVEDHAGLNFDQLDGPILHGGDVRFIVYGDTRVNSGNGQKPHGDPDRVRRRDVAKAIQNETPDFVVHTGDMVTVGTNKGQWEDFQEDTHLILRKNFFYPVLGNHEYYNIFKGFMGYKVEANNYFDLFGKELKILSGNPSELNKTYSISIGDHSYLIVLDSNMSSKQDPTMSSNKYGEWFLKELEKSKDRSSLLIALHHPLVTGQDAHHQVEPSEIRLLDQLKKHSDKYPKQKMIVLSGHNHFFEHYTYQSEYSNTIDFLITGGGGAPLREDIGKADKITYDNRLFSRKTAFSRDHYVLITLQENGNSTIETRCFPKKKKNGVEYIASGKECL